jgi:hypothetical protein
VTRRAGGRPPLTPDQRCQRFWDRERHDLEVYSRLTERQRRRQPHWQLRERQWRKAALLTLMAGGELPESLARMWALVGFPSGLLPLGTEEVRPAFAPQATGLPSGLFSHYAEDVRRRAASGTPWSSPWGSPWSRPTKR